MWDWLFQFFEPLDRVGVPYAIVGSVASSLYGEPRATNDVDIVIQMSPADAPKLVEVFPSDQFYVPPVEVIEVEFNRAYGGHINVIADYFKRSNYSPEGSAIVLQRLCVLNTCGELDGGFGVLQDIAQVIYKFPGVAHTAMASARTRRPICGRKADFMTRSTLRPPRWAAR